MAVKAKSARKKKDPKYNSFKLRKRIKPNTFKPLPGSWKLWKSSLAFLRTNWKKVGLFLVIYMALYVTFVRGLGSAIDFDNVKNNLDSNGQSASGIMKSIIFFGVLVSASNAVSSDVAAAYQSIIFIIGSLAFIWLLRALHSKEKNKVRVRDSFYLGIHPLVPVLLVLLVIAAETIPLSIGGYLLSLALSSGVASLLEATIFIILAALFTLVSLYLISGTWAALYIVSLPGAQPWKSIKASNKLISVHRWSVMRRLVALVVFLFVTAGLLTIPLLMLLPDGFEYIAEYGFFLYILVGFTIAHTYLYKLYKSLL